MSKRVLILVEGQTEERFVKDVLAPAFFPRQLYLQPTLLTTKRVKDGKNFKGGVTNYGKFKNDAVRLLNSAGGALVTTMLDYYGLPPDFPGMASRPQNASAAERVSHVEAAIAADFGKDGRFLPFLALHEFEAWLFSEPSVVPVVMTAREREPQFTAIRAAFQTPEEINERPEHAPSKRILSLFPAFRKTLHGPLAAGRIGLDVIRRECPHFNQWVCRLEEVAIAD